MTATGGSTLEHHCVLLRRAFRECQRRLAILEHSLGTASSAEEKAKIQQQIDDTTAAMVGLSNFYTEDGCSVDFGPIDQP